MRFSYSLRYEDEAYAKGPLSSTESYEKSGCSDEE